MIDFFKKPYYTFFNCKKRGNRRLRAFLLAAVAGAVLLSGCAAMKTAGAGRPIEGMINVYRGPLDHLNAVRTGTCPMHPSCSEYALQTIDRHGAVIGWMMSFDRLMRCGRSELKTAPKIPVNGRWKYHDPVEANDFWWNSEKQNTPTLPVQDQKN